MVVQTKKPSPPTPIEQQEELPTPKSVETCPSFRSGHLPSVEDVERLRTLSAPHVESFNYFLEYGLSRGIKDIEPYEICLVDPKKLRLTSTTSSAAQQDSNTAAANNNNGIEWDNVPSVEFWLENVKIGKPINQGAAGGSFGLSGNKLMPRECRERGLMYAGPMRGDFCFRVIQRRNGAQIPGKPQRLSSRQFGNMPIMTLSKACHLHGTTPKQLVQMKEEANEFGGYFIVNGIERCVRLLQIPRRNYAQAIQRSSYKNRGNTYTDLGVAMRCANANGDQSSITNTVHYLTTGGVNLRLAARKQEFLIPVILLLRALSGGNETSSFNADTAAAAAAVGGSSNNANGGGSSSLGVTDQELYERIVQGDVNNTFLVARVGLLLQDARARFGNLNTPQECLAFLGARFRRLSLKAETTSDAAVGHYILRKYILIHLNNYRDKLECLLLMLRKLYAFAAKDCGVDNADSLQNHEILVPGHLCCSFIKEKFDEFLQQLRLGVLQEMRKDYKRTAAKIHDVDFWGKMVDRFSGKSSGGIGKKYAVFLSTGNVVSTTGLDLMQVSGYTIVAERLNFLRFCAHFRSVHRGQFFMEMKTTAVRKLLPDQWGFLCPVHTPDGGPCGLLGHLAIKGSVICYGERTTGPNLDKMDELLISLGVAPVGAGGHGGDGRAASTFLHLPVCLDGRVIGGASPALCKEITSHLRWLKVQQPCKIPHTMEVAFIPPGNPAAPLPGLYMFTVAARMVRPVIQLATGRKEMIGPLEQGFMDIACLDEDVRDGITTHQEIEPTNMLSLIANLTPFSDQNQSPRNMYQCQMGKQTMGTPLHSFPYRPDNKLYKLQTPQAPLVQTRIHGEYKMDEYPNGTNVVIAVLSYTGFDMEDAMILNKSSYERGLAHATIYKTIKVDLMEESKMAGAQNSAEEVRLKFGNKVKGGGWMYPNLDEDGLPKVGDSIKEGDALYCVVDSISGYDRATKHKEHETAYVQDVRMLGRDSGKPADNMASITLRFPRKPTIGDKFSSRHGQKGVMSITWQQQDMPWTESGITPDILFNPHGFPSRMTIGMLVEMIAAKGGALHGHFQEASPFTFHESGDQVSIDYFGEQLQSAGYNYYGSEPLYSGVSGCAMHADLYVGVCYYQRLRHMVNDKYQVRATGPTNELTRQPIKGRKKGGGIRLGEMERDSLLSHGTAFLLHDRLLNCSDKHIAYVCSRCGDLLTPTTQRCTIQTTGQSASEAVNKPMLRLYCRNPSCIHASGRDDSTDEAVVPIILPYVYRYLVNELAGMNIKMKLEIQ